MADQAAPFNPGFHLGHAVTRLGATADGFVVETLAGTRVAARAVIIAAGAGAFGPNRPPLDGIERFENKSVFYLVRRREDFRGRRVVIAGGGTLPLPEHTATGRLVLLNTDPVQLELELDRGEPRSREFADAHSALFTWALNDGNADCLLPFFGLATELGPLAGWGLEIEHHHIRVDPATCATSRPGIFAIGDIAAYPGKLKLILSGFAEAALAAHAIHPLVHPGAALHFEYSTTKGVPGR